MSDRTAGGPPPLVPGGPPPGPGRRAGTAWPPVITDKVSFTVTLDPPRASRVSTRPATGGLSIPEPVTPIVVPSPALVTLRDSVLAEGHGLTGLSALNHRAPTWHGGVTKKRFRRPA
jgi:hypothetical protein